MFTISADIYLFECLNINKNTKILGVNACLRRSVIISAEDQRFRVGPNKDLISQEMRGYLVHNHTSKSSPYWLLQLLSTH